MFQHHFIIGGKKLSVVGEIQGIQTAFAIYAIGQNLSI